MFVDRTDAGRRLVPSLAVYSLPRPLVLALPRGGVPVAVAVATALDCDLDVLVVRKLGVPGNPEFAMGALGEDGALIVDHATRRRLHISSEQVDEAAAEQGREIERRVQLYRGGRQRLGVAGRNIIIVDDGLATGSTAEAAITVVKHLGAAHVTLAVPVGSTEAVARLSTLADDVICLEAPEPFVAVGRHYENFDQVTDEEVVRILGAHPRRETGLEADGDVFDEDVRIDAGPRKLTGRLTVPASATGIVLFAHGSGSGRLSPRNTAVAGALHGAGLGTLLFDLLNEHEADNRGNVFDIELLAARLVHATRWLQAHPAGVGQRVGYFGSSTGAAAALVADAMIPGEVSAVVSRGGRPELAGTWLEKVVAPTLLIVGGIDYPVIDLNIEARHQLRCTSLLEIVPGASHLFEEAGTLAQVARLAQTWFVKYLG